MRLVRTLVRVLVRIQGQKVRGGSAVGWHVYPGDVCTWTCTRSFGAGAGAYAVLQVLTRMVLVAMCEWFSFLITYR